MSELRRPGGADDADKPAVNDKAADKPVDRPRFEIRTADMNADWPVDRRAVTKAQRHYIDLVKQNGDVPPGNGDPGYVRDWATGESLDHEYPHITGAKDRTKPGDPPDETVRDSAPGAGLSLPHLDARAFRDTDEGWDDIVAPAAERDGDRASLDADDRPGEDLSTPAGVPGELGPDDARSTSMSISEARDRIAKSDTDRLPDFHRDNSRLAARAVERTDEGWYDRIEGPETSNYDSKFKNFRAKYAKKSDDIGDMVHDSVDNLKGIFSHPPTHESVGHVPPAQDMPAPLQGTHTAGDLASGVVAGAFAVSALTRMMQDKLENRKDRHGDNG